MRNDASPQLESLEGERGLPTVNEVRKSTPQRVYGVLFIVVVIAMGALFTYLSISKRDDASRREPEMTNANPTRSFVLPQRERPPPDNIKSTTSIPTKSPDALQPIAKLNKTGAPLMVMSQTRATPASSTQAVATPITDPTESTELGKRLQSTESGQANAGFIGDPRFVLAKGSFIDCVLQTRLDSTVPGMTRCVVTRPVYSDNGQLVLVEKGSIMTGEYQSDIQQGQVRIFVVWDRIKTPNGIVVQLDSPGTDSLGGSGLPGHVNNHFLQRFGSAILLSVIDDVAEIAAGRLQPQTDSEQGSQETQNTYNFANLGKTTQDMATEALKYHMTIPPTFYKNQGERIGIMVSRDLNFSSVYQIKRHDTF